MKLSIFLVNVNADVNVFHEHHAIAIKAFIKSYGIFFSVSNNVSYRLFQVLFVYKGTSWKRGDVIFLEPELLWNLLDQFWKVPIKIKKLKILLSYHWHLNIKGF